MGATCSSMFNEPLGIQGLILQDSPIVAVLDSLLLRDSIKSRECDLKSFFYVNVKTWSWFSSPLPLFLPPLSLSVISSLSFSLFPHLPLSFFLMLSFYLSFYWSFFHCQFLPLHSHISCFFLSVCLPIPDLSLFFFL